MDYVSAKGHENISCFHCVCGDFISQFSFYKHPECLMTFLAPSPSHTDTSSLKFASCITSGNYWLISLFLRKKNANESRQLVPSLWQGVMEEPEALLIRGSNTLLLRQGPLGIEQGGCWSSVNRWKEGRKGGRTLALVCGEVMKSVTCEADYGLQDH